MPVAIACLIVRYTHNLLTEAEQQELDHWLEASEENIAVFEDLIEGVDNKVFNPETLISETDDLLDIWMMAGLIARQMHGIITADEERSLHNWMKEAAHNKALYETFSNKANLQKFLLWLRELKSSSDSAGLN